MKAALVLLFVALTGGAAFCQSPDSPVPSFPPGPIVPRAPELARWKMTVTYPDQRDAATVRREIKEETIELAPRPVLAVVTKTGKLVRENIVDELEQSIERWCIAAHHVSNAHGSSSLVWITDSPEDPLFVNYSKQDFPGLGWVRKEFYTGTEDLDGRKAFVFRDRKRSRTAWLDAETRLPIAIETELGKFGFEFLAPPGGQQTAPPAYQAELQRWAERERRFQVKPPRPY